MANLATKAGVEGHQALKIHNMLLIAMSKAENKTQLLKVLTETYRASRTRFPPH